MKIVLQKFIAQSGYCSRRRAEELIRRGKISINKKTAELGMRVNGGDDVRIREKKIKLTNDKIYVKLNKPNGYTCTNRKFIGEKNVFELLKKGGSIVLRNKQAGSTAPLRSDYVANIKGLHVVGRLDKDSRGLVLLTNDGELTQRLTHPRFQHEKKYVVEVRSVRLEVKKIIASFKKGVNIGEGDGIVMAKGIKYKNNNIFEITLTEGKKRQIRRMFRRVGCEIVDLVRTGIGNLELRDLKEGEWKELSEKEIARLH